MLFQKAQIIKLESTRSTNQYISELLRTRQLDEGTVISAYSQTNGKGLEDNIWESEAGKNLTLSVVLYPTFLKPELQFQLTKVVSLAVCKTLDTYKLPLPADIKWPNDIYMGNRKIAGILIKNEISGSRISATIVGLGLNVNQEVFSKNAPGAVSLKMLTGNDFDTEKILTEWHSNLAYWYEKLMNADNRLLDKTYLERLYLLNTPAEYRIRGERKVATIKGLAEYGMLRLECSDGIEYTCSLKEVEFVNNW